MTDEQLESLKKHVAGQTVLHTSPFESLTSHKNNPSVSNDFLKKWISPFYSQLHHYNQKLIDSLLAVKNDINDDVISKALGDFNWRSRQTGAYFAAIKDNKNFIDIIGVHLLKSEVTFACKIYCVVFASFNTPKCVDYIETYLNYYLNKPDLFFDQREALEAIVYLDKINGTNLFSKYQDLWTNFLENKPYWDKEINTDRFEKQIATLECIKNTPANSTLPKAGQKWWQKLFSSE
jgi:hypothetical protein